MTNMTAQEHFEWMWAYNAAWQELEAEGEPEASEMCFDVYYVMWCGRPGGVVRTA